MYIKTYGQIVSAHFPNGLTDTATVSLRLNTPARISDVMKTMDASFSSENENDYCYSYKTSHQDGETEWTSQEART